MTGRRLYDLWCDALAGSQPSDSKGGSFSPPAWPFLPAQDKATWSAFADALEGEARAGFFPVEVGADS